jgi:trehalose synthase-fused probable maltokinase
MRGDIERRESAGGEPVRARMPDVMPSIPSEQLLRFLLARRWFGAKGRDPQRAVVVDAVPLGTAGWIARVDVTLRDGVERYQLTLGSLENAEAALREGLDDEEFRRALRDLILRGGSLEGRGVRWVVEPTASPVDTLAIPTVAKGEQSNTSLIFGDRAIMKLYRKLERGVHPDAEIARFLTTRARFPHTPELHATVRFESDRGNEVAGMLQRFLAGSRDAWSVALDRGRPYFEAEAAQRIPFAAEAETLGDITRGMHVALAPTEADAAFAPVRATRADVARWADATRTSSVVALDLLERALASNTLDASIVADARAIIAQRDTVPVMIDGWLQEIGDDAGERIRHHGDYHLGQVLHTRDGAFMIIDFEGEPARPLEERRAPHAALRDVAGMLRSFSYAAATLAERAREELGDEEAVTRATRWEREMRESFMRGYLPDGREHPRFLPSARARVDVVLQLFETEKAFYELAYELNNRPSWVWIPLRGLAEVMRSEQRTRGPETQ